MSPSPDSVPLSVGAGVPATPVGRLNIRRMYGTFSWSPNFSLTWYPSRNWVMELSMYWPVGLSTLRPFSRRVPNRVNCSNAPAYHPSFEALASVAR